ncbi:DinB family protein [Pedobacter sp. ISL-68]|uniref:DinB family protein n=1 Tax=unclassified Pedobacter TaxID=2628915 RepID=UPI001BEAD676|nr:MULTISPECIES: DinB family protein [unclassified Pedobacter]MBT2559890.1 DinB family protein [Pedobacter sp. ISL-64]MBT2592195.1 DinB family protein [Pedobacter sp. ISL-68]
MNSVLDKKNEILQLVNQAMIDFENIPDEAWNNKPQLLKWSKKELLGHLVDSAVNNIRRLVVGQYEQGVKIIYHQDEWVSYQNYQEAAIAEVIMLWKLLNYQISRVIENIPEEKLQNTCDTGKGKIEMHTLSFFIDDYLVHLKYHLNQITLNK